MASQTNILLRTLPVMESFYTIQGEGFHQGKAAYFIRLAGCDVGCVWCDVKESWERDRHPEIPIVQLIEQVLSEPARLVVVTGGEPLMHDLVELTNRLHTAGCVTHLETSGAYPLTGDWDWICLSPKKFKAPLPSLLARAHELKVVIFHPSDFEWAEQHAKQTVPGTKLYLQPEWSRSEKVTPLIVEYVKKNPQWELSLQIHKFIQVP